MTEKELELESVKRLGSHDYCDKGFMDKRGSKLCRDNMSVKEAECRVCLANQRSKENG